jgi:hypothetical protein
MTATVLTSGLACSSGSEDPAELAGHWDRIERWDQRSSFEFDRIATTSNTDAVAWFTRQQSDGVAGLAYWEIRDGDEARRVDVPLGANTAGGVGRLAAGGGGTQVLIPVAVATDEEGWAAVAVTRDRPAGENKGLMVWQARLAGNEPVSTGEDLPAPDGATGPPASVSVGRSSDSVAVACLFDGNPAVWHRDAERSPGAGTSSGPGTTGDWLVNYQELGTEDGSLVSLRLAGDGERLVLAGVEADGTAHVWTSTNGRSWDPVDDAGLPDQVGAVGLLTVVDHGRVLIAWLDDEDSAPFNATSATIQLLDAEGGLSDEGSVEADPQGDIDRVRLAGAALGPLDGLVIVGAAVGAEGVSTPMMWAQNGDDWDPTDQPNLDGHLDHEFRVVVSDDDERMVALATATSHPDIEAWRWRPGK